jgi:predicted DNA-binding ribbon-helix-helix protein
LIASAAPGRAQPRPAAPADALAAQTCDHWGTPLKEASMTAKKSSPPPVPREIERVQTGVRLEKRLVKVLKGLAEYLDLSLGDLLEGIALHALENKPPFKRLTLEKIAQLRRVYGLELVATDSHHLREGDGSG